MKKRLILATLAFVLAAVVTLSLQYSPDLLVERVVEDQASPPIREEAPSRTNVGSAPVEIPTNREPEPRISSPLSPGEIQNKVDRSFSSARIEAGKLQPLSNGFEASLTIDGIPVFGARVVVDTRTKDVTINIVPPFQVKASTPSHSRALAAQAKAAAKTESEMLKACTLLSLGDARIVWLPAQDASDVHAAYAVEVYYACGRTRTREDWIYADPSLEKLGRIKRRN